MKKILLLILLATALWVFNNSYATIKSYDEYEKDSSIPYENKFNFRIKNFYLTHGEQIEKIDFTMCNYWGDYNWIKWWEITFLFENRINDIKHLIDSSEFSFNYSIYEDLFKEWECKDYTIDSIKLKSIYPKHYLNKKTLYYWTIKIVWISWSSSSDKIYPSLWAVVYNTYKEESNTWTIKENNKENNYGLSESIVKNLNKKINSIPENKRKVWLENFISKAENILSKRSLSEKSKNFLTWIKLYYQDYLQNYSDPIEDFDIEELLK